MRIPIAGTIVGLGLGLVACQRQVAYLNADELVLAPSDVAKMTPCNDLGQQGEDVDLRGSHAPAPTPAGGTIEDGTYVLTSSTLHTKNNAHGAMLVGMGKITMRISGPTSQTVRSTVNGRERRATVTRVSSGTVTTLHTTCAFPTASESETSSSATYTASSSSLQFITPGPAGTVVTTYTKLPSAPGDEPHPSSDAISMKNR